jgi:mannose-1-phosphate guanylyltransferase/mannose-6-phosphate isomerase
LYAADQADSVMFDDCVIMAGGSGTRLWPASSLKHPKQFLPLPGQNEKTFFHAALDRALAVTGAGEGRVIIIAGAAHVPHIENICSSYRQSDTRRMVLIPEPEAKNTAAAVACAAVFAECTSNAARRSILVLTSDHVIRPEADFLKQTRDLEPRIRGGGLAVFGINPHTPETGYGYIEAAAPPLSGGIFAVKSFHEKPDKAQAEKYLKAGNFFWNSGMFAFSSDFILNEFKKNALLVSSPFERLSAPEAGAYTNRGGLCVVEAWRGLDAAYREAERVSFDIAIAEKCKNVIMAKAGFEWFDVGSWDEYARLSTPRGENVFSAGSGSCFVDSAIPVALCGVDNLIVIVREGPKPAILIAKKGETQRVKEIVELIKAGGGEALL